MLLSSETEKMKQEFQGIETVKVVGVLSGC